VFAGALFPFPPRPPAKFGSCIEVAVVDWLPQFVNVCATGSITAVRVKLAPEAPPAVVVVCTVRPIESRASTPVLVCVMVVPSISFSIDVLVDEAV
jgi:hypothetical protein